MGALLQHQLILMQVHRQRAQPWTILRRGAHVRGKGAAGDRLARRAPQRHRLVLCHLQAQRRYVPHLPAFHPRRGQLRSKRLTAPATGGGAVRHERHRGLPPPPACVPDDLIALRASSRLASAIPGAAAPVRRWRAVCCCCDCPGPAALPARRGVALGAPRARARRQSRLPIGGCVPCHSWGITRSSGTVA